MVAAGVEGDEIGGASLTAASDFWGVSSTPSDESELLVLDLLNILSRSDHFLWIDRVAAN